MAKPNYAYEKRQRDLAKKQKKEEKRLRKAGTGTDTDSPQPPAAPAEGGLPAATPEASSSESPHAASK